MIALLCETAARTQKAHDPAGLLVLPAAVFLLGWCAVLAFAVLRRRWGMEANDFQVGDDGEMIRCGCGRKYVARVTASAVPEAPDRTFFEWFGNGQVPGGKCECGADLLGQWSRAMAGWETP